MGGSGVGGSGTGETKVDAGIDAPVLVDLFAIKNGAGTGTVTSLPAGINCGKRGDGHRRFCRIRRADARNIHLGRSDPGLTGYGGLAGFGSFIRELGIDQALREGFWHLKAGPMVIYPMEAQMRLLIDAAAVGEHRVFGVEALSADPLFVHLAGGVVRRASESEDAA